MFDIHGTTDSRLAALAAPLTAWAGQDLADVPVVNVTVDLATLTRSLGHQPGRLDAIGPITADTARRIACDAAISRILTDGPSHILDVGRRTRTVPVALRRALVAHWADGGPTDQHNLASGQHTLKR